MKIQVYILTLEDIPNMLKKSYELVNIAIFARVIIIMGSGMVLNIL